MRDLGFGSISAAPVLKVDHRRECFHFTRREN